ncbi:MAG: 2-oxo-4-hydroxy-4-carboxy-5-ureidoimidazoline decarboxylase [Actinomycetota bacterium]|nr:2-oxo-4-hydroxy-4-carboxy-5-ureidoimidazoline decarboxylase [Actinomycetota bacterium]
MNNLPKEEFVAKFTALYEHSPWVAEGAWHERPFSSRSELHGAFVRAMYEAPRQSQLELIGAHPDLAGKAAVAGELTPESTREQASAGLDRLTPEEYEAFTGMNRAYRERFGFPMIVCVREHTKESILQNAESRLENSGEEEIEIALGEIAKIARLRLQELVEADSNEAPQEPGDVEQGGKR